MATYNELVRAASAISREKGIYVLPNRLTKIKSSNSKLQVFGYTENNKTILCCIKPNGTTVVKSQQW